jgi:hypothetical protein
VNVSGFVAAMDRAADAARRLRDANIAAAAAVSLAACRARDDRRRALALAYERARDAYVATGDSADLNAMLAAVILEGQQGAAIPGRR